MRHLFLLCILATGVFIAGHTSQAQDWARLSPAPLSGWAQSLCVHQGTTLIMGQPSGPYRSTDNGTTWIAAEANNLTYGCISVASDGSNLYAARGSGGVSRSTDHGVTWIEANEGLPTLASATALASAGSKVFVGLYGGSVYASTNGGSSWTRSDSGITNFSISALAGTGDTVLAGTTDGKVFLSTNRGMFWTNVSPSFYSSSNKVNAIFITNSTVLLGDIGTGSSPGILRSDDWGMTWTQYSTGINEPDWGYIAGFARVDTFLFAGIYTGFNHGGVYRGSLNSDWVNVSAPQMLALGPPAYPELTYIPAWSMSAIESTVFAGMSALGLYRSEDLGETWQQITSDVSAGNEERTAFAFREDTLYTGGSPSFAFISTDNGGFWEEHITNLYNDITSYAFVDTVMFAGHGFNAGVSRSMDGGRVWERVTAGLPTNSRWVNKLASSGTTLLAATRGGVCVSSDFGDSWLNTSWNAAEATSLHASASVVLASDLYQVYRSTDVGQTWIQVTSGLPASWAAQDFARIGSRLFMSGGPAPYVLVSIDEGLSWSSISGPFTSPVWALASDGDTLYAASDALIYFTTDNGQSWVLVSNAGLSGIVHFRALMVKGGYIYAGMGSGGYGAYRRPVPGGGTSVAQISNGIPERMMLLQNYPNPFNPKTNIGFQIADYGFVRITVYDLIGREVASLVNEELVPGTYEVSWEASRQSSGVYYYRLSTAGYSQTRKLLLLR